MDVLRSFGLTIMIVIGLYFALILSYILIPLTVFGVIFYVVYTVVSDSPT